MQDQHALSVAGEIRRSLSPKLISGFQSLNILLVGEKTEADKGGLVIKIKGHFEVRGTAPNIHVQSKVIAAIKEKSGGRQVKDFTSVKKDDVLRRKHGFF